MSKKQQAEPRMLFVLGFLLRLIDLSLWIVTLGPVKTVMLMLKGTPKVDFCDKPALRRKR